MYEPIPDPGAIKFKDLLIPPRIKEAIDLFVKKGIRPGSFTTKLLANDNIINVITNADPGSHYHLRDIIIYIYNFIPAAAWGSKEAMDKWKEKSQDERDRIVKATMEEYSVNQ